MGAKGRYHDWLTEDGLLLIKGWAREGLTDEQIATEKIGISERSFTDWKARFPAINSALKEGKRPVDVEVEDVLKKKAVGYTVTVKKAIKIKTKKQLAGKGTIEEEHIEFIDDEVYVPPDTTALIFWLKNRRPDRWRDRQEVVNNEVEPVTVVFDV